jgi:hypothetical protein
VEWKTIPLLARLAVPLELDSLLLLRRDGGLLHFGLLGSGQQLLLEGLELGPGLLVVLVGLLGLLLRHLLQTVGLLDDLLEVIDLGVARFELLGVVELLLLEVHQLGGHVLVLFLERSLLGGERRALFR